jgi:hypothetical protein
MRRVVLAAAIAALAAAPAIGQPNDPQAPASDIVVTGVRPEQIQSFVEQVSAIPPSINQIARWNDDICTSVAGASSEQAQHIVDRISYRAEQVGLSPGRPGCQPNVYVFLAAESDGFARRLVDERKSLFAYYHEEHVVTLGQEALTHFVDTPRAIRWWHVIQTRGGDGDRLGSGQASNGSPPPPREMGPPDADSLNGAQAVRSQGTRLRSAERQDFNRVVVIVDGARAAGYPIDSLADYIAMVTLAQIDPAAQTRDYPTILNLFDEDPDKISFEMTNWDLAYLDGLYRATRNAASSTQQVREISRRMQGDDRPPHG